MHTHFYFQPLHSLLKCAQYLYYIPFHSNPIWSQQQWKRSDEQLHFWLSAAIQWFTEDLNPL